MSEHSQRPGSIRQVQQGTSWGRRVRVAHTAPERAVCLRLTVSARHGPPPPKRRRPNAHAARLCRRRICPCRDRRVPRFPGGRRAAKPRQDYPSLLAPTGRGSAVDGTGAVTWVRTNAPTNADAKDITIAC
jgi:hypothetical protein